MSDERVPEPETGADERDLLLGWLAFHRDALANNCAGLDDGQLQRRAAPPSMLSLIGLVRHLTEMERVYLSQYLAGQPAQLLYCTDDEPDGDIEWIAPIDVAASLARWQAECCVSDEALDAFPDLTAVPTGKTKNVRWLLQKVIGEYARHNGHADIVREAIDGRTGE